ncbi:hypothetical protein [Rhodobacter sp. NSM]|uniref:hypothetical protein n=1 Tax=Rhodobacter sp. NSM TaxID=3457501 RepID=UPI003FD5AAC0
MIRCTEIAKFSGSFGFLLYAVMSNSALAEGLVMKRSWGNAPQKQATPDETGAVSGITNEIADFREIEGEWAGSVPGFGVGQSTAVLSATDIGIQLVLRAPAKHCEIIVTPEPGVSGGFAAFLFGMSRKECEIGDFFARRSGDKLLVQIEGWKQPAELTRMNGPASEDWIRSAPPATVRGIALGDAVDSLKNRGDDGGHVGVFHSLRRVYPQRIGMMGISDPYLDADVAVLDYPMNVAGVEERISIDNTGIFSIQGRVVALLREHAPPENIAPRLEAVEEALLAQLGEPTVKQRGQWAWYFNTAGEPLLKNRRTPCGNMFGTSSETKRPIGFPYLEINTSPVEILRGLKPRIERGNVLATVEAANGCGYSIVYTMTQTGNGLLDKLNVLAFAHEPVRGSIWNDRAFAIRAKVEHEINPNESSASVTPKL